MWIDVVESLDTSAGGYSETSVPPGMIRRQRIDAWQMSVTGWLAVPSRASSGQRVLWQPWVASGFASRDRSTGFPDQPAESARPGMAFARHAYWQSSCSRFEKQLAQGAFRKTTAASHRVFVFLCGLAAANPCCGSDVPGAMLRV